MNCWTDVLKDFDSRIEVMGLKCPCGNADGINDLFSRHQTIYRIGALSIAVWALKYTASDSAPAQNRIWQCETLNDHANV